MKCNDSLTPKTSLLTSANLSRFGLSSNFSVSLSEVLGNDSRILGRVFQARRLSCGKSIYSSNFTVMMWHHQNWLSVSNLDFFNEKDKESPSEQALHIKMTKRVRNTNHRRLRDALMFLSHARSRLVYDDVLLIPDENENWRRCQYLIILVSFYKNSALFQRESTLNQIWSALNVSETSTRVVFYLRCISYYFAQTVIWWCHA